MAALESVFYTKELRDNNDYVNMTMIILICNVTCLSGKGNSKFFGIFKNLFNKGLRKEIDNLNGV